jgi:hypothetical protein
MVVTFHLLVFLQGLPAAQYRQYGRYGNVTKVRCIDRQSVDWHDVGTLQT